MQLRGRPAASIVHFGNLCTNNLFKCAYNVLSPRTATVGVKKRGEREGEEAIQVLRYDEERRNRPNEEKGDNRNRCSEEVKQCIFCTPKKRRHTGACALRFDFFFFFLLFHPLSFSFS